MRFREITFSRPIGSLPFQVDPLHRRSWAHFYREVSLAVPFLYNFRMARAYSLALGDRIGRKYMILVCYVILMIGITLEVIADLTSNPIATFFGGKFINGLGIGALQTTGFIYITEVRLDILS